MKERIRKVKKEGREEEDKEEVGKERKLDRERGGQEEREDRLGT